MTCEPQLAAAAKRIVAEMEACLVMSKQLTHRERDVASGSFIAFGISLLIIYESYTGRKAIGVSPGELIKWAKELSVERVYNA